MRVKLGLLQALLEAIRDPAHEEHAATLEWCGGAFDPAALRADDINTAFRQLGL